MRVKNKSKINYKFIDLTGYLCKPKQLTNQRSKTTSGHWSACKRHDKLYNYALSRGP